MVASMASRILKPELKHMIPWRVHLDHSILGITMSRTAHQIRAASSPSATLAELNPESQVSMLTPGKSEEHGAATPYANGASARTEACPGAYDPRGKFSEKPGWALMASRDTDGAD